MARIFSVNSNFRIDIDDSFILRVDEDFLTIEIPDFNWHHHSSSCNDGKAFIEFFGKNTYQWLLKSDEDYERCKELKGNISFFKN